VKFRTAVFSGRFDPPNTGHYLATFDLLEQYSSVVLVVLQAGSRFYRKREACTAQQAVAIFNHFFDKVLPPVLRQNVRVIMNRDHFGFITKKQFLELLKRHNLEAQYCDYVAGNNDVLDHVESLGVMPCKWIQRVNIKGAKLDQYVFESTEVRKRMQRRGSTLGQEYGTK
jgi:phosphopantetheine adenylyltransferase